jgi:hypothetical protein
MNRRPRVEGEAAGEKPKSLREEIEALEKKRASSKRSKISHATRRGGALDMPMRTFLNRLDAFGIPRARAHGAKARTNSSNQ